MADIDINTALGYRRSFRSRSKCRSGDQVGIRINGSIQILDDHRSLLTVIAGLNGVTPLQQISRPLGAVGKKRTTGIGCNEKIKCVATLNVDADDRIGWKTLTLYPVVIDHGCQIRVGGCLRHYHIHRAACCADGLRVHNRCA
ncbi:MAG: hypothetical protein V2B19_10810 [Pseudomonadota bacterium]